jgi:hypothetical protein
MLDRVPEQQPRHPAGCGGGRSSRRHRTTRAVTRRGWVRARAAACRQESREGGDREKRGTGAQHPDDNTRSWRASRSSCGRDPTRLIWSVWPAVVASKTMSLWLLLALVGLVKLVVASLMLWLPFRSDSAMLAREDDGRSESDDEGGTKMLPGSPSEPHPRLPLPNRPRRGPHGSPSPPSPARVRTGVRRVIAHAVVRR